MTIAHHLSSCALPTGQDISRDLPARAVAPSHPAWSGYDRKTLVYDVVYLPSTRSVRLFLPRLLNLESVFSNAEFHLGDKPVQISRHAVYRRFEVFDIRVEDAPPKRIGIQLPGMKRIELAINHENTEDFRGRRVIYTLLKDQRLEWIQDWMRFHQREHGADAVLIADNGSSRYDVDTLQEAMDAVSGYAVRQIISVPLPWGPRGNTKGVDDGKYLQTTLLNIVRDRFFRFAYGVLNVDVDELVLRLSDQTIFDKVQRWGYVTFPGDWRYSVLRDGISRHADHFFFDAGDRPCATKYCFRPSSFLGRMCLSVHSLERVNRALFSGRRDFRFIHCRNISTSWKYDRTKHADPRMETDREAKRVLLDALGAPAGGLP